MSGIWWEEAQMASLAGFGVLFAAGFALKLATAEGLLPKVIHAAAVPLGAYYPARAGVRAAPAGALNTRLLMICGAAQDSLMLRRRSGLFSRRVNTPQGGLV